jgi:hypothetical protein
MNGVSVQMKLAKDLPLVRGDRGQLLQVMVNLIINGIEAMSPHAAGARDLLIRTVKTKQAACSSPCVILVRAWTLRISSASSTHTSPRRPMVWEWAYLPRDHPGAWGTTVGDQGRGPGHHLAVHLTGGHGQRIVS